MRKGLEQGTRGDRLTVLREPVWRTVCVYLTLALAGAGIGWLVGLLADWLVTLPWAPLQGPAELLASIPAPWLPVAGSVAGLVLGLVAQHEQLVIRLSDDRVELICKGREQEFSHDAVATAFRDGKRLVLIGHDGGELTRQECDLDAGRVADAFAEHGHPWADADPYEDEFRRWVPESPGLPEGANALLKARQKALEKEGPSDDDVRDLREELARLGVVVKDEKRRQFWRTFRQSGPA
ncbi:YqeB family protein [Streptomyces halobius]|uniref:PH (Pleckstrin Homology) domain-containing protein n=1 Tax=Streptomyces halobius TaxID=2879846 RepID=A0ABY4MHW7_9ACTN|nr:hypothetical protein [Streptomyces halobius]UQA97399.1 hypothetical protein K9S39_41025 [Streptomyces halobius]